jgi:hypothetical protein
LGLSSNELTTQDSSKTGIVLPKVNLVEIFHCFRISLDPRKRHVRRRIGLAAAWLPIFQRAEGMPKRREDSREIFATLFRIAFTRSEVSDGALRTGSATSPRFQAAASRSPSSSASPKA